jgi:hypothetical protein
MCKPFHARFSPFGATLTRRPFANLDDRATDERCEAPVVIAGDDSLASNRRKSICEYAPVQWRGFANAGGHDGTTFQREALNLTAACDDPTRGFGINGRKFFMKSAREPLPRTTADGKLINSHAMKNCTCVLAKSDYLKLQIPNTRYSPATRHGVDFDAH